MPERLPPKQSIEAAISALRVTSAPGADAVNQLFDASNRNFVELSTALEDAAKARQQADQGQRALGESETRRVETDKLLQLKIADSVRMELQLRDSLARLSDAVTHIADLEKTVADLRDKLNAQAGAAAPKSVVDLVGDLRKDAHTLFAKPFRASDAPGAPGVVVDGLEFEIRGDLAVGEKVGIRPFAADRAGPEGASVVRFSLKPEVRITVPDKEGK